MDDKLYAPAFGDHRPAGFTNNYLEARSHNHFFDQHYSDYRLYEEPGSGTGTGNGIGVNGPGNTLYRDILKTRIPRSLLSDTFFGEPNIMYLKKIVCKEVYQRSGGLYQIKPEAQSTEAVVTVMMSIYLDFARNLPTDIKGQVQDLNGRVLQYMIPSTISRIKEHLNYIRSHSQQPLTMNRPLHVSSAGTRSNDMSRTFLWMAPGTSD